VQLVVFDVDETLTLVSYMIEDEDPPEVQQELVKVNFESPWVTGSRIVKLQCLLSSLRVSPSTGCRALAILSRNNKGAKAVLQLLEAAGLAPYFCVIWTMPWRTGTPNGAYQSREGRWEFFEPPVNRVDDHKADVLNEVVRDPQAWFPSFGDGSDDRLSFLSKLNLEGILLVDDQRANFQSPSGSQVLRYCKVARYDATYEGIGFVKDMGGLGAHCDADYETLKTFVDNPAMCKERLYCKCVERYFPTRESKPPVKLIVFEFDETLTLATFLPEGEPFSTDLAWSANLLKGSEWTAADLLTYNFESPFASSRGRLDRLKLLLKQLIGREGEEEEEERVLAILTTNNQGPIAILNLLRLAGLAEYFSAIWKMPSVANGPFGVWRQGDEWREMSSRPEPESQSMSDQKADVLSMIAAHPKLWFPQLQAAEEEAPQAASSLPKPLAGLSELELHGILLVDSERASFQSCVGDRVEVLRYCKVARYDEHYRACGPLSQMGGIGSHSDRDWTELLAFVRGPWNYAEEEVVEPPSLHAPANAASVRCRSASVERRNRPEEPLKARQRKRKASMMLRESSAEEKEDRAPAERRESPVREA